MDVLSPLFQLVFRAVVIVLPLTTGWLAFRRLVISRSPNAWLYALTCLFAAVTAAGLLPWALGLGGVSWIFFLFAAFCPAVWIGVVMLCDMSRSHLSAYEPNVVTDTAAKFVSQQKSPPLVLEKPEWPGEPIPVFRHSEPANAVDDQPETARTAVEATKRNLLSIAREMRKNESSDQRRPKLLPPPDVMHLPFLKGG